MCRLLSIGKFSNKQSQFVVSIFFEGVLWCYGVLLVVAETEDLVQVLPTES